MVASLMRALFIFLIVLCALLAVRAVPAHAAIIKGTAKGDVLTGTLQRDKMYGYGGADTLRGRAGSDLLVGGGGADTLECNGGYDNPQGGYGEDLIYCDADDGKPDLVECGPNEDIVFWRVPGTTFTNCEHKFLVTGSGD